MATSPTVTRRLAQDVLVRVARDAAFAERVLNTALERIPLPERDRALVTELVYGTLRHTGWLDTCLAAHIRKPLTDMPVPVLAALRLGAYQILCMRVPPHSAVNESVALVRRYGRMSGFVNAVLRSLSRNPPADAAPTTAQDLARVASHPVWLVQHIIDMRGWDAAYAWVMANNAPAPLMLRVNRLRSDTAALTQRFIDAGLTVEQPQVDFGHSLYLRRAGAVKKLAGFQEGLFTVQDTAATLVGHLAAPQPGSVVLDACAAPGGKSTHAAELMNDQGLVIAVDVHPGKTRLIQENSARLGLTCVQARAGDSSQTAALRAILGEFGQTHADTVICDAPCSGLGTLRRNPEGRHKAQADVAALARLQAQILSGVAPLVRTGGVLVYAVCTVTDAEGPAQIAQFLQRHPEFTVEAPDARFAAVCDGPYVRTWTDTHGTDSFFAARLRRA